ncbi:hypothetical protein PHLCEN_2v7007 [Hermanssonia centrifuga]|uniref:RRM domain-containing protein n=1 Tax=Hermanssonia centrifuga TaxID=98765 RepID=A0A2R6NXQ5_9APHY|nr:hypothetical protein PHLCEN_2v7007 [Hermanssonia centrifuga]
MASLLDRISAPGSINTVGPVRNKGNRAGTTSPYVRQRLAILRPSKSLPQPQRTPKGDINGAWQHDLFDGNKSLSARLSNAAKAPKINLSPADRALREANGEKGISIKGASSRGNVVEVSGLAEGTTSEDVEAIFKRCGAVTNHKLSRTDPVTVRLTFKFEKDAQSAVKKFDGQPADGRILSVKVVGGVNATLGGRLGVAVGDSVDVLMEETSSGSKLRSDDILAQGSRASVLIAPPGTDPSDYVQAPQRGGRGRGRGRGRGGRRGIAAGRMDID